jgi:hypothetical protein
VQAAAAAVAAAKRSAAVAALAAQKRGAIEAAARAKLAAAKRGKVQHARVGKGASRICGGRTGITSWSQAPGDLVPSKSPGIYVDVDTVACAFGGGAAASAAAASPPQYVATVMSSSRHGTTDDVPGSHFLSAATAVGFRLFLMHSSLEGAALLNASRALDWQVSWLGDEGANAGQTIGGHTGWRQEAGAFAGLFVDVSTRASRYQGSEAPHYFATLFGVDNSMHIYRTAGAHVIYDATPTGFRLYISTRRAVTPAFAEQFRWTIGWVGVAPRLRVKTKIPAVGSTPESMVTLAAGESSGSGWVQSADKSGVRLSVSTHHAHFRGGCYHDAPCIGTAAPALVTSINAGAHMHWRVSGAGSIYGATAKGFDLFLDKSWGMTHPLFASFANLYKWKVAYVGYDGPWRAECKVSSWSAWSACTSSCGVESGGTQLRHRNVRQSPRGSAAPCPPLLQTRKCNDFGCPVDCAVGAWGKWRPRCFAALLGDQCTHGSQKRARAVRVSPAFGGKACPTLAGGRACPKAPCVGQGESRLCGGTASSKGWQVFGTHSIYMRVSTKRCKFDSAGGGLKQTPIADGGVAPQYAFSLLHLQRYPFFRGALGGGASVMRPTSTGFEVVLDASAAVPPLRAAKLLRAASEYDWIVSWAGDNSRSSGLTTQGASGWKAVLTATGRGAQDTVALDVDTSAAGFKAVAATSGGAVGGAPPRYFASLRGKRHGSSLLLVQGASVIHQPTPKGFRVLVRTSSPKLLPLTPARAEGLGWCVSWIGVAAGSPDERYGGTSAKHGVSGGWLRQTQSAIAASDMAGSGQVALVFSEVSTATARFEVAPAYLASLVVLGSGSRGGAAGAPDMLPTGGMLALDSATQSGFRAYLALSPAVGSGLDVSGAGSLPSARWAVNYAGFGVVDCRISDWSLWSRCTASCGGGSQQMVRRVLRHPQMGGKPCPKGLRFRKTRPCATVDCVGKGSTSFCGGSTAAQKKGALWLMDAKPYGHHGLYIDVDTSSCGFGTTAPTYIASLNGNAHHWQLTGSGAVINPTGKSFRMVVTHPVLRDVQLIRAARAYKWSVSWVGAVGDDCGSTPLGSTDWHLVKPGHAGKTGAAAAHEDGSVAAMLHEALVSSSVFYVDVDTSACRYPKRMKRAPRYFTSLLGATGQWHLHGAHVHYAPDLWGFRIYAVWRGAATGSADAPSLAEIASKYRWAVAWFGTDDLRSGSAGPRGWSADHTGYVHAEGSDNAALRMHVDTTASHFRAPGNAGAFTLAEERAAAPAFVVSLAAARGFRALGWRALGGADVNSAGYDGFALLLDRVGFGGDAVARAATKNGWVVNYIGTQRGSCSVTKWSQWSECDCAALYAAKKKAKAAARAAARKEVVSERYRELLKTGMKCTPPVLREHRPCQCHLTMPPTSAPTAAPTPVPTPPPVELVFDLRIGVESVRSFGGNVVKRKMLQQAVAAALGGSPRAAPSRVLLTGVEPAPPSAAARARARAAAAALVASGAPTQPALAQLPAALRLGIVVHVAVLPPPVAAQAGPALSRKAALATVTSGGFLVALSAQLSNRGLLVPLNELGVQRPRAQRFTPMRAAAARRGAVQLSAHGNGDGSDTGDGDGGTAHGGQATQGAALACGLAAVTMLAALWRRRQAGASAAAGRAGIAPGAEGVVMSEARGEDARALMQVRCVCPLPFARLGASVPLFTDRRPCPVVRCLRVHSR